MAAGRSSSRAGFAFLFIGLASFVSVAAASLHAHQAAQTPRSPDQTFKSGATAILVDVVVRDQKGQPVVDLTPADFELFEDDVRQPIGSVTLVAPGSSAARSAGATSPATSSTALVTAGSTGTGGTKTGDTRSLAHPTLLALVFDRLSPEARALAHDAALAYVKTPPRADDFAGVFHIDHHLDIVQTYTTDRERVRKAIEAASTYASSTYARVVPSGRGDRDPSVSPTQGAESPGSPDLGLVPHVGSSARSDDVLRAIVERMEGRYQELMHDQQGHQTIDALIALVDSMSLLPGRKTVVFFAESLSIPWAVQQRFLQLVSVANRANVSIYTLDTAGLRVQSAQAETAREITRIGFAATGEEDDPDANGSMTSRLEHNERILREDPRASLGMLAKYTGGFFIDNTNNLAAAFARIDDDRRFHYVLTYAPTNSAQDGTYRHITVKVHRPSIQVRARDGYFATATLGTIPVLQFETAALAALNQHPRPTRIPVRAGAFSFPEPTRPGQVAIVVSLQEGDVGHLIDQAKTGYRTDFTVLARLVDGQGATVRKGSQPYQLTGTAGQVDAARRREVLFYRQPNVPPGHYTLDFVVHDALTGEAGTGSEPLVIDPAPADAPIVSSLIVVRRAEQVPEADRDAKNPLYVGDVLLYPNLGEPLHKSVDRSLTFFYTVYPRGKPIESRLVIETTSRSLANLALTVPPPDASGRIQHLARLPLDAVPPGSYTLRLTVADATTSITRACAFTVAP